MDKDGIVFLQGLFQEEPHALFRDIQQSNFELASPLETKDRDSQLVSRGDSGPLFGLTDVLTKKQTQLGLKMI
jgi:hypothetical protein